MKKKEIFPARIWVTEKGIKTILRPGKIEKHGRGVEVFFGCIRYAW